MHPHGFAPLLVLMQMRVEVGAVMPSNGFSLMSRPTKYVEPIIEPSIWMRGDCFSGGQLNWIRSSSMLGTLISRRIDSSFVGFIPPGSRLTPVLRVARGNLWSSSKNFLSHTLFSKIFRTLEYSPTRYFVFYCPSSSRSTKSLLTNDCNFDFCRIVSSLSYFQFPNLN